MSIVTSGLPAEIPLFSNMDDEERSELRSLMTERIFQPGQIVMKGCKTQWYRANFTLSKAVEISHPSIVSQQDRPATCW